MTTWKRTIGYTLLALLVSVTAVAQYQTPLPEARANVLSQQVQLSSELGLASQITAYPAVAADQTRPGDRLQHLTAKPLDSGLCDNCPGGCEAGSQIPNESCFDASGSTCHDCKRNSGFSCAFCYCAPAKCVTIIF
jgi:hypothetical protein